MMMIRPRRVAAYLNSGMQRSRNGGAALAVASR